MPYAPKNKEKRNAKQREYVAKRMAEGRCVACNSPTKPLKTKRLCADCAKREANYQQMRREINRDARFTARGNLARGVNEND